MHVVVVVGVTTVVVAVVVVLVIVILHDVVIVMMMVVVFYNSFFFFPLSHNHYYNSLRRSSRDRDAVRVYAMTRVVVVNSGGSSKHWRYSKRTLTTGACFFFVSPLPTSITTATPSTIYTNTSPPFCNPSPVVALI